MNNIKTILLLMLAVVINLCSDVVITYGCIDISRKFNTNKDNVIYLNGLTDVNVYNYDRKSNIDNGSCLYVYSDPYIIN